MTKKKKKLSIIDRLPKNHGEWLELVIKFTKRAIKRYPTSEDDYLKKQLKNLEKELNEYRRKNKKNRSLK